MKTTFDPRGISAAAAGWEGRGSSIRSGNIGSFIKGQIRRVSCCEGRSQADEAEGEESNEGRKKKREREKNCVLQDEMFSVTNRVSVCRQFLAALAAEGKPLLVSRLA